MKAAAIMHASNDPDAWRYGCHMATTWLNGHLQLATCAVALVGSQDFGVEWPACVGGIGTVVYEGCMRLPATIRG